MKYVILNVTILTLLACSKDLTDERFIGTWDVTTEAYFQANANPTLASEGTCTYEFSADGTVSFECDTSHTSYWWFYRNSPRQIILTDMGQPFTNEVTWDIIKCEKNSQVWERVNTSSFGINTYRRILEK